MSVVPDLTAQQRKEEKDLTKVAVEKNINRSEEEVSKNWVWKVVGRKGEKRIRRVTMWEDERLNPNTGMTERLEVSGRRGQKRHQNETVSPTAGDRRVKERTGDMNLETVMEQSNNRAPVQAPEPNRVEGLNERLVELSKSDQEWEWEPASRGRGFKAGSRGTTRGRGFGVTRGRRTSEASRGPRGGMTTVMKDLVARGVRVETQQ